MTIKIFQNKRWVLFLPLLIVFVAQYFLALYGFFYITVPSLPLLGIVIFLQKEIKIAVRVLLYIAYITVGALIIYYFSLFVHIYIYHFTL